MKFYVYEHWRPDTDTCFYVGKGHGRRAHEMRRRKGHHDHIVQHLARQGMCVEVRMVASGLSEAEAFVIEKERIAFWRAANAILTNIQDGGEGATGPKSSGHREKISASWTDERRAATSARHKGRVFSPETIEKMRVAARNRSPESNAKMAAAKRGVKLGPYPPERIAPMHDAIRRKRAKVEES